MERNPKTLKMIAFGRTSTRAACSSTASTRRSLAAAVRMVVDENLADHIDLNFGCPVPKVTRKGGGSALPVEAQALRPHRQGRRRAAAPAGIPVTVKMRKGIDDDHLTYVEAGLIAQEAGVAAVALHARTAAQRYSGEADWEAIATLKQALDVPVLGNGDIWEADDALRMVRETGCDGVVVGRGCLGRPWLFADLQAAFAGRPSAVMPTLGEVAAVMRRHADLLVAVAGAERDGCTDFRKHVAWYLKGFPVGAELRRAWRWSPRCPNWTTCSASSTRTRRSPSRPSASRAAGPTPPARSSCRTAGWKTATTTPCPRRRARRLRRLTPPPPPPPPPAPTPRSP